MNVSLHFAFLWLKKELLGMVGVGVSQSRLPGMFLIRVVISTW